MSMVMRNGLEYPDDSELFATLLGIPSVFERLIYVASLALDGSDGNGRQGALRAEHQAVFENWLGLSLQEKQADLEVCGAGQGHSLPGMMRHWIEPHHHQCLIPESAPSVQRELFIMELEVLFLVI